MDIQQIRYFWEIAKQESFSRAAEALYVTQPILTRCVKNLEEELDVRLILRTTKAFALTDAGKTLAHYGQLLVQQHQDLYQRIQDVKDIKTGELQISSPGVLLDMYFPRLVTEFHKRCPLIHINIFERGSRPVAQDVLEGRAEIGLVMLPLEDTSNLHVFPIIRDEVRVLVPQEHPFAKEAFVELHRLQSESIITYNASTTLYNSFLAMCKEQGFAPNIAYKSMMPNFILDTIACGDCIGVLPGPMAQLHHAGSLRAVPLRPRFPWEIAMITRKDRYISHAASGFLAFSQEYFAQLDVL